MIFHQYLCFSRIQFSNEERDLKKKKNDKLWLSDPFLPRVVELARQSSDRQTKVAACELLHSLTLYMLGRSAQQPGEQQKRQPMDRLYRKLFPALLSLACDVEQVGQS